MCKRQNSPEIPFTKVSEAGGANRGKFRPGHVPRLISVVKHCSSSNACCMTIRPTDGRTLAQPKRSDFLASLWQCVLLSLPSERCTKTPLGQEILKNGTKARRSQCRQALRKAVGSESGRVEAPKPTVSASGCWGVVGKLAALPRPLARMRCEPLTLSHYI